MPKKKEILMGNKKKTQEEGEGERNLRRSYPRCGSRGGEDNWEDGLTGA